MRSLLLALALCLGLSRGVRAEVPLSFDVWVFETAGGLLQSLGLDGHPAVALAFPPDRRHYEFFVADGNTRCLAHSKVVLPNGGRGWARWGDPDGVELEVGAVTWSGGGLLVDLQARLSVRTQAGEEGRKCEAALKLAGNGTSMLVDLGPLFDDGLVDRAMAPPAWFGRYLIHRHPSQRTRVFALLTAHCGEGAAETGAAKALAAIMP